MELFREKVWLARPLMHEEEQDFIKLAFDENYITTGGTSSCDKDGCAKNLWVPEAGTGLTCGQEGDSCIIGTTKKKP